MYEWDREGVRLLPDPPIRPSAEGGDGEAVLTWTPPRPNGSAALTGYVITPVIGGTPAAPIEIGASTASYVLDGLTNGVPVTYTVAARNAHGVGPSSSISAPVTPARVPGSPTDVHAIIRLDHLTATWTPPDDDGGAPITGYYLDFIPADGGPVAERLVVVDDLVPAAGSPGAVSFRDLVGPGTYTVKVAAVNAAGTGPRSSESEEATVPPFHYPFASWGEWVDRQFSDVIGRPPTPTERTVWVGYLTHHWSRGEELLLALRADPDNVTKVDPVVRLYRAYFGRVPDRAGLLHWVGSKRGGRSLQSISSAFAASSEFHRKYGKLTNRAFVERIYENVLGRPGDASGIAFWTSRLDRRVEDRGAVMASFSESSEYVRTQTDTVTSIVLRTFLLGRAPTQAEVTRDTSDLAQHRMSVGSFAAILARSEEYAVRFGG